MVGAQRRAACCPSLPLLTPRISGGVRAGDIEEVIGRAEDQYHANSQLCTNVPYMIVFFDEANTTREVRVDASKYAASETPRPPSPGISPFPHSRSI